ncbi:hypothetical protein [Enterobacter hormaechei]|nr:hypothetical protein [Enterobacter hormaechei]
MTSAASPATFFRHISDNGKSGDDLELFSRQRARGGRGHEQRAEQQTLQSLPWMHRRSLLR